MDFEFDKRENRPECLIHIPKVVVFAALEELNGDIQYQKQHQQLPPEQEKKNPRLRRRPYFTLETLPEPKRRIQPDITKDNAFGEVDDKNPRPRKAARRCLENLQKLHSDMDTVAEFEYEKPERVPSRVAAVALPAVVGAADHGAVNAVNVIDLTHLADDDDDDDDDDAGAVEILTKTPPLLPAATTASADAASLEMKDYLWVDRTRLLMMAQRIGKLFDEDLNKVSEDERSRYQWSDQRKQFFIHGMKEFLDAAVNAMREAMSKYPVLKTEKTREVKYNSPISRGFVCFLDRNSEYYYDLFNDLVDKNEIFGDYVASLEKLVDNFFILEKLVDARFLIENQKIDLQKLDSKEEKQ